MGIVYRARHLTSERAIALKTVQVPAPKWLDCIRREIQALTRIQHPGVVRIVDHGVSQGWPWFGNIKFYREQHGGHTLYSGD